MHSRTITEKEEATSSVTVERSKKGEYGWSIKLYFLDSREEDCLKWLEWWDKVLRERFAGPISELNS